MAKVSVVGSGAWGIALAILLNNNGHNVSVWSAFEEEIQTLLACREHKKLLPGVIIPDGIELTSDINCVSDSDVVLLCVPSFAIGDICVKLKKHITDNHIVINAGKGLEPTSGKRFSQIIEELLDIDAAVILSGPTHAEEVARKIPTAVVVSSSDEEKSVFAQGLLMNSYMRVYVNNDTAGVELCGALKNIIALCSGICDGMGYGDNTKAALMTRGLSEITRLGLAMGGKPETFMGLAGMGDLVVTCCSPHSRNHRAGVLIGKGMSPAKAIETIGTVEGYYALGTAYNLSKTLNVEMPIVETCYRLFNNEITAREAVDELMLRPKCSERIN